MSARDSRTYNDMRS